MFLVSDEFHTFCVIFDRNEFCKNGHMTPEDMEMSGIAERIEWKHSRIPAGPPSGRNRPLKSRNLVFRRQATFFQSLGEIEILLSGESKVFLGVWNWSEVLSGPGAALAFIKGHIPREERQCCGFS